MPRSTVHTTAARTQQGNRIVREGNREEVGRKEKRGEGGQEES